ncbi:hypothetical protein P154DRAFT_576235 [Amniculicola lignicola CBS 123094]|uniref:Uncharacterized protein n=1 Tax=Amniculicola lignicola CBS 123094 TaxID=1392246 RepID=A0A6A5WRL1_9PLEO|nr:hypothetical protein P154DRAFT_576235 [Amniculicola lignicola CBS 123094]
MSRSHLCTPGSAHPGSPRKVEYNSPGSTVLNSPQTIHDVHPTLAAAARSLCDINSTLTDSTRINDESLSPLGVVKPGSSYSLHSNLPGSNSDPRDVNSGPSERSETDKLERNPCNTGISLPESPEAPKAHGPDTICNNSPYSSGSGLMGDSPRYINATIPGFNGGTRDAYSSPSELSEADEFEDNPRDVGVSLPGSPEVHSPCTICNTPPNSPQSGQSGGSLHNINLNPHGSSVRSVDSRPSGPSKTKSPENAGSGEDICSPSFAGVHSMHSGSDIHPSSHEAIEQASYVKRSTLRPALQEASPPMDKLNFPQLSPMDKPNFPMLSLAHPPGNTETVRT